MSVRFRVIALSIMAAFHASVSIVDVDRDMAMMRVAFSAFCLFAAVLTERYARPGP